MRELYDPLRSSASAGRRGSTSLGKPNLPRLLTGAQRPEMGEARISKSKAGAPNLELSKQTKALEIRRRGCDSMGTPWLTLQALMTLCFEPRPPVRHRRPETYLGRDVGSVTQKGPDTGRLQM